MNSKCPIYLQVVFQRKTLGTLRIELLSFQALMKREFFEALKETRAFANLPETLRVIVESVMSAPAETINTDEIVEESAP